jgi:RimJ/RimL family protein N-acetyltransferase
MQDLRCARLCLRTLTEKDAAFILTLANDSDWLAFIGDRHIHNLEDAKKYIRQGPQKMQRQHGVSLLLVANNKDGEPMGLCGLLQRPYLDEPDLGFAFLPQYRGQGFAFEAAQGLLLQIFKQQKFKKILAFTSLDNDKSVQLLTKLGFNYLGTKSIPGEQQPSKVFEILCDNT